MLGKIIFVDADQVYLRKDFISVCEHLLELITLLKTY